MTASVAHFIDKFVPENYNLFLDINRSEKRFTGNVAITGEALDNSISLHQKGLVITSVLLDNEELSFEVVDEEEAVHIELTETGVLTLVIEFSGRITDNMTGIYPSYYTHNGVKKEIISTQFESHFAREAFPSVDEPEAKATFDFSVKFDAEEGDIALSNMPEINSDLRKETGIWTFDTTPRMSSYLLAFGLGALQGKTAKTANGTEVGVFSTVAQAEDSVNFALDIAVRVINFYEDYFQVKYPIPLSYHLALPDFSAGAMENWGLVTYREVYLLVDKNSTVASRQQVALVIAHELAHQWFGNLVTMKWWDDLWLNESFANMMEYVSVNAIEPTWNIFEDFQASGIPRALQRDATDGVQSVHMEVNHPDEINTLFDGAIVYAKGSRLMHMLRRWLGDTDFAAGLKIYFEKHQYKNTVGRDLWRALSEASGKEVAAFMDTWLEQPGYPLVTAQVAGDTLILSQKQFFIGENTPKNRLWEIPLNSNWTGLPDTLSAEQIEIPNYSQLLKENSNNGALRLNTENTAHYLTDYQGELLEAVLTDFKKLDTISKLQILQERRLLAESGAISYASLIELLNLVESEESYLIAEAKSHILFGIRYFIDEGTEAEEHYFALVRRQFKNDFERLGTAKTDDESDQDEMVRQIAFGALIQSNYAPAMEAASAIFQDYKENIENIPAAVRQAVLINQMKQENSLELTERYVAAYVATNDSNFRRQLIGAVSYVKNADALSFIIDQLKNKDVIKPQDLYFWYSQLLAKNFSQETIWDWSRENWLWIKAALGGDMSFDSFINIPANIFKTSQRLSEYKEFFEPQLEDKALERNILMGIKTISARVELIATEKAAVESALKD
ncbi:M1 family metallopeptidase [Streptococcus dentiloxodontae]